MASANVLAGKTGWAYKRIGELGEVFTGRTPSTERPDYFGEDYHFITPGDMHQWRYVWATQRGLSADGALLLKRIQLPPNSICVSCIGWQMGEVVMTSEISLTNQQINSIIPDKNVVDPYFLYYSLLPRKQELLLLGSAIGVRTPILNKSGFCDLRILTPPLPTQHKIAAILSAYDDLIENNNRRIKILEEMARLIYHEWFVNFRFPGHENIQMVDSPLGKIPEGWDILNVEQLLGYHIGGGWGKEVPDKKHSEPAYVIRGTDIPSTRYAATDNLPLRYHTVSNLKCRILYPGDIVFEVSGGSKDQPVGRALLVHERLLESLSETVICASFCKLLRPDTGMLLSKIFFLHLLEIYDNRQIMQYQVQSTGITNFKFQHFLEKETVIIPSKDVQSAFAAIVDTLFDEIQTLGQTNDNLRQTRDLLLPKLISGELDVSELDIDTGEEAA